MSKEAAAPALPAYLVARLKKRGIDVPAEKGHATDSKQVLIPPLKR
jgi:hypothetical protein